ncbi:MAG TPA: right-handed parallel beta-helix repeat-containing protein [Verrucomicrobiae bacterium]|nr:right-handed parallel beta-helix repeat-containing protein [Verrucomicrobiae bacterium]
MIYVKGDATGTGDGSSWSNAFVSLQPAIDAALVSDQVWIAQGTYRPTSWPNGGTTDREKHFSLKQGVSVYGGFAGNETALVQRDASGHPVILSGDLLGDDADTDGDGFPDQTTATDNVFHVFYHPASRPLTPQALLESVAICDGNGFDTAHSNSFFGAGMFNNGASPVLRACRFRHNSAEEGGALYLSNSASPPLEACTFENNSAVLGAAICAPLWGPSTYTQAMTECAFFSNKASMGAAYYTDRCGPRCLVASNCVFVCNWSEFTSTVDACGYDNKIFNCVFSFNGSTNGEGGGSALFVGPAGMVSNCIFSNNGGYFGGALLGDNGEGNAFLTITVTGCAFVSNAYSALWMDSGSLDLRDCIFERNGGYRGGAVYLCAWEGEFIISNCVFRGNSADEDGGAIACQKNSGKIYDTKFSENRSYMSTGGAFSYHFGSFGALIFENCSFVSNGATDGGAIRFVTGKAGGSQLIVSNSTYLGNWAQNSGGAIMFQHSLMIYPPVVRLLSICNGTFVGNEASSDGGAVALQSAAANIVHCTLADNSALNGSAISGVGTSTALKSSIIWGNANDSYDAVATHCIIQGGYPGVSNLDIDPLLNPLGFYGGATPTRPFGLGSPAKDAGLAGPGAPTHDQRGFERDALPDIGACEFQALALISDVTNPAAIGSQFTLRAISDIAGVTFQWFGRQSANQWDPMEGGTNGLFATPALDLGLDLWVRVMGQGTNVDSAVQQIEMRGTYPEWVAFHGLAGADAETGASPVGDGIPNLVKYASGLNPHVPAVPGDHSTFFSVPASNTVCLTWIQSKTPTDLTWGFRQSHDFRAWSPADAVPNLSESNSARNVWSITMPVETDSLFLDVEVTRPVP